MGLLDDAIREHLDLKRRHGADPIEIERAEREALGPVRRGPEAAEDVARDEELVGDDGFAYDEVDAEEWEEPFADEPQTRLVEPGHNVLARQEPEQLPVEKQSPSRDERANDLDADASTAPHGIPKPASHPTEAAGQDTEEYAFQFGDDEPESKGEDMLEETPGSRHEAPDQEVLWFQQRPPRDFDFDG